MGTSETPRSLLRICLLGAMALLLCGCHFVQKGGGETEFQNQCYELAVIEQAIEKVKQAREGGLDFR